MIDTSSPYFQKQLKVGFEIIDQYNFKEPFHLHLKKQFQLHKNWGSKDRKSYRSICYSILRNYPLFKNQDFENRLETFEAINSKKLVYNAFDELLEYIDPLIDIQTINRSFNQSAPVFFVPFSESLSESQWSNIPGFLGRLSKSNSVLFEGNSNLDSLIASGLGYIQDYSSTLAIKHISNLCNNAVVWDACCASGGKSLSVSKFTKPQKQYCSDIRPEIIKNLKSRYQLSPFQLPHTFTADAQNLKEIPIEFNNTKNMIIADLPCSGSGNWRRTPENRWNFNESTIQIYQKLQRSIFTSLYEKLPIGGHIYYLTCSVFKAENQENIEFLSCKLKGLKVESQEYFGGELDDHQGFYSDYIFGCLIRKT